MDQVERDELVRLVNQAQAGDPSALSAIVERYWKKIYAFCYCYLRSQAIAEEVTQETFLKVVEQIKTLKDPTSFVAWLYRIARNLCHDEWTHRKRNESLGEEVLTVIPDCGESSEDFMDKKMERERVAQAISRLSEDHRDVLVLVHYERLSYEEAAEILDIEVGTLKSRLFRALQKLREQLDSLRG